MYVFKHFLLVLFAIVYSLEAIAENDFVVAVPTIPERLNISALRFSHEYFILRQFHDTMFEKVREDHWTSSMIESINYEVDGLSVKLCLKNGVRFSDGTPLTIDHILANLTRFQKNDVLRVPIKETTPLSNRCLKIRFENNYPDFMLDLDSELAVIVLPGTEERDTTIGVSPYSLKSKTQKEVVLIANGTTPKPSIERIVFHRVSEDPSDLSGLELNKFDDIFFASKRFPPEERQKRKKTQILSLNTSIVVVNIEDKKLRDLVWNCIPRKTVRDAFLGDIEDVSFLDVRGLLPIGIAGAERGSPNQKCQQKQKIGRLSIPDLRFITFRKDKLSEFSRIFDDVGKKIGVNIQCEYIPPEAYIKALRGKSFDITVMGIAVDMQEQLSPFATFKDGQDRQILKFTVPGVETLWKEYTVGLPYHTREALVKSANISLEESHAVLSLSQYSRPFYQSLRYNIPANEFPNGVYLIKDIEAKKAN